MEKTDTAEPLPRVPIIGACFITALGAILLAFTLTSEAFLKTCFTKLSFYLIFLMVLFWIAALIKWAGSLRLNLKDTARSYGPGVLISIILAVIIVLSVKPLFRVPVDDTETLATSQAMTFHKRADIPWFAKYYYDMFNPNRWKIEKRPLLFPFFLHLIHASTGYRAENAFFLNFIIFVVLLSTIFICLRNRMGAVWSLATLILICSQGIVSHAAGSAGYELLHAFLLVLSFTCLWAYLNDSKPLHFELLWVNLLLLANVRPESFAYPLLIVAFLAAFRKIRKEFFVQAWVYPFTPLLILPVVWQSILVKSRHAEFGLGFFADNNLRFLKNLLNFEFSIPYATVVLLVGFLSLLFFLIRMVQSGGFKNRPVAERQWVMIVLCTLLAHWCIVTAYKSGHMTNATVSRYFVPFALVLSVLAVQGLRQFQAVRQRGWLMLTLCTAAFLLYHPIVVRTSYTYTQASAREYVFVMDFLEKQPDKNFLLVSDGNLIKYTAHRYGQVGFGEANRSKDQLQKELARHLYRDIFVVQEIEYETQEPTPSTRLAADFDLEPVARLQKRPSSFLQISRVVGEK